MKQFIIVLIVGVALFLLLKQQGYLGSRPSRSPDTTIVRDTVWSTVSNTVIKEVPITGTDHSYQPTDPKYLSSANYDSLLHKFDVLVRELTARNFYRDSLVLDSLGYIVVKDTVQFNKLQKRSYDYHYSIPKVTETMTITKYAPPVGQLYLGGSVELLKSGNFNQVHGGLLYKNRKDQIYGGYVGYNPMGQLSFGVQTYWKIKLRK